MSGEPAVDQLMSTEIRSGCFEASAQQNLNTIAMVSLPTNGDPTGVLATFNDEGRLRELKFIPIDIVRATFDLDFADQDCALL